MTTREERRIIKVENQQIHVFSSHSLESSRHDLSQIVSFDWPQDFNQSGASICLINQSETWILAFSDQVSQRVINISSAFRKYDNDRMDHNPEFTFLLPH